MPLSIGTLTSEIISEMAAVGYMPTPENAKLAKAIATAVVNHVTSSAEVVGGTCAPDGPISGGKVL